MVIDHSKIKIPANYVLVKIDEDFDKIHFNGKETTLYVGSSYMVDLDPHNLIEDQKETVFDHADHWADTGVIIKAPAKYSIYSEEFKKIRNLGSSMNENDVDNMASIRENSLKFITGEEYKEGHRIKFNYACRINNLTFKTDIGDLMFINCKDIEAIFDESGMLHPVNGNVFFELIQPVLKSNIKGLELPTISKKIWDLSGIQKGIVTDFGLPIKKYLEEPEYVDETGELEKGSVIYFKSYNAFNIESENHFFIFGGKEIFCINRYNILATE